MKEHALFRIVNILVNDAKQKNLLPLPDPNSRPEDTKNLLEKLAHELPNRIYVGGQTVLLVLFFKEQRLPQVYLEASTVNGNDWKTIRAETAIFSNISHLEQEIQLWRKSLGLTQNLMEQPAQVWRLKHGNRLFPEYIHTADCEDQTFALHYFISTLKGPRMLTVTLGEPPPDPNLYVRVAKPPNSVFTYAHPL